MASSHELRTAARVLREEGYDADEAIELLEKKAEKEAQRELYVSALSNLIKPTNHPNLNGSIVIDRLVKDGWTPPEFLR